MENEYLNPEEKPEWAKPVSTNIVGIDLSQLDEKQLKKLIKLMDEINYTPIKSTRCTSIEEF